MMEQREAYAVEKIVTAPTPPDCDEAVCDRCGWRFGKLVNRYRQDGTWRVLYIYGAPPSPTYNWSTDCPSCGAQFTFHAHRKGRQAAFE